jgi:hypothetical protein
VITRADVEGYGAAEKLDPDEALGEVLAMVYFRGVRAGAALRSGIDSGQILKLEVPDDLVSLLTEVDHG